jgi:hypothetical protein
MSALQVLMEIACRFNFIITLRLAQFAEADKNSMLAYFELEAAFQEFH